MVIEMGMAAEEEGREAGSQWLLRSCCYIEGATSEHELPGRTRGVPGSGAGERLRSACFRLPA